MTQVVEHVIAAPVGHAGLEDGVLETAVSDDLFGRPLRLVVARSAARPSAEEADHVYAAGTRLPRGLDDVSGAVDVYDVVGLMTDLPVDSGAMCDRLAPGQRFAERSAIRYVDRSNARLAGPSTMFGIVAGADAGDKDDIVSPSSQFSGQMAPNEAGASRDGDLHARLPRRLLARSTIWAGQTELMKSPTVKARRSCSSR